MSNLIDNMNFQQPGEQQFYGGEQQGDGAAQGVQQGQGAQGFDDGQGQFAGSMPPQSGGSDPANPDSKTTLWYVMCWNFVSEIIALTCFVGWVNLNRGLMRTSSAACGTVWASRST